VRVRCRRKKFMFAISSPDEFLVWVFVEFTEASSTKRIYVTYYLCFIVLPVMCVR